MKSGNLNFLEPFGPLQACNGTALHFLQWDVVYLKTSISIINQIRRYYDVAVKMYPSYGHFCMPVEVAVVIYQYHILLLCSGRSKLFVLL